MADGEVTAIFPFLVCKDGWGCKQFGGCPRQTNAVMIYHPSLGKTINYGEMDANQIKVSVGQKVTRGQVLGRASYCGMLHFELYQGRRTK